MSTPINEDDDERSEAVRHADVGAAAWRKVLHAQHGATAGDPADGVTGGVVGGLRRWIDGHDAHIQAAVWLLLAHEVWPRRGDFLRACVHRDPDGQWWIDFTAARTAFDHGEFHRASATELAVLDLVIDLGVDRFRLRSMGTANSRAIATAVAHAVGADR